MALSEVKLQELVQKAIRNDINQGDMEVLHKELLKRYESEGLNSQQERIILAACISYNELYARFCYIKNRTEEWRAIN
ncbi:MAG: hypothetical protein AAB857_04295 [Patescibacteria group bacterium]